MLCPSCNGFRPANNAPCPLCNAPSPLVNEAWNGQNASFASSQSQATFAPSWGGNSGVQQMAFPSTQQQNFGASDIQQAFPTPQQQNFGGSGIQQAFPTPQQQNFGGSGVQQMSFPMPGQQQPMVQTPDGSDNSFWAQNMAVRGSEKQQSLLPVPYQAQSGANEQGLAVLPTGFPTLSPGIQPVNSLVPALPDSDQEAPVYVPPMYTKPRPIIPRYRAISGLISVIIVFALLCSGSAYFAQVTGKLTGIEKLLGFYTPPSITSNQQTLPVPSDQIVYTQNPAAKIIDSVGISTRTDHGMIPTLVNKFTVGQTIWLVCGARVAKQAGVITVKWYANNNFYKLSTSQHIASNQLVTATFQMLYGLPAEGKAEVYWNNDLAATVLFVVEPAAS